VFNSKKASVLKKKRFHKKVIWGIALMFFIFAISFLGGQKALRNKIADNISEGSIVIYESVSSVSFAPVKWIKNQIVFVKEIYSVHEDNFKLKKEIEELELQNLKAHKIYENNKALKKQLFFAKDISQEFITAKISLDNTSSFSKSILINAGKEQGIKKDSPVLANGYLLGQIIKVYENKSRVLLITDSNIKIPVVTAKTRHRFFLTGDNENESILIYPEDKVAVEKDEIVIASNFGNIFPDNILIGKISSVKNPIKITPFLSLKNIEFVQVLKIVARLIEAEEEIQNEEDGE